MAFLMNEINLEVNNVFEAEAIFEEMGEIPELIIDYANNSQATKVEFEISDSTPYHFINNLHLLHNIAKCEPPVNFKYQGEIYEINYVGNLGTDKLLHYA